ncbi:hypothetical protein JX265_012928 [Neoarthrinium moseri]|uniref:Uncharacterized protein n=1 Tax=Neoarthrinium moseri TaxID=1658444 RepID=A0A9P9W9I1_9PEZI|nr:hypothetical protein JX265_012928 [Neoarthrinium moseri]
MDDDQIACFSRVAKVANTKDLTYDTTPMPAKRLNPILNTIGGPVRGLSYLQFERTRGAIALSLQYAVSYLRNQLDDPTMVSSPCPDNINWFFYPDLDNFIEGTQWLDPVMEETGDGEKRFFTHPAFVSFRTRPISIWVIRMGPNETDEEDIRADRDAHWAVLISYNEDLKEPVFVPRGRYCRIDATLDPHRDRYYDRKVFCVQFFDPLDGPAEDRSARYNKVANFFNQLCIRAGTILPEERGTWRFSHHPTVTEEWETGYCCYAIIQQYMRRVQLLRTYGDYGKGQADSDFWRRIMWANYDGMPHVDACRESMMAGCACRAIAMSGFKARLAVELPGRTTTHRPELLDPLHGPGVDIGRPQDPEEETLAGMIQIYPKDY